MIKLILRASCLILILLASHPALAFIELNGFYFTDNFKTTQNPQSNTMFIEAVIGFAVDKKQSYLVGWNYGLMSVKNQGPQADEYKSTQMGPRFVWRIGKAQNWSLGLGYYLLTTAKYTSGSSTVEWEGSALKVDFGYSFEVAEAVHLGLRGNYSSASYNEQLDASTTYGEVSFSRTHIYPSLYAIWIW